MAKQVLIFFISLLPLLIQFTAAFSNYTISNAAAHLHKIPAAFFFGDSFLDTGNNDYVATAGKAVHLPYGRDFPGRVPTGRWSNGLLIQDLLSAKLGLKKLSPPFLNPRLSDADVLTGVNFASAGSGYFDGTSAFATSIPFSRQVMMFRACLARLKRAVGNEEEAAKRLSQSLIYVTAGSNDFARSSLVPDLLVQRAGQMFQELYNLGGRKFIIAGVPPLGCFPLPLSFSFNRLTGTCIRFVNANVQRYNMKLKALLSSLQNSHPDSKFIYLDFYGFMLHIIQNARRYGFTVANRGCCGTGLTELGPLCNALTPTCPNANNYIFFDAVHQTERFYILMTKYLMKNVIPKV